MKREKHDRMLQEIRPAEEDTKEGIYLPQNLLIGGLLLVSTLLAIFQTWGDLAPQPGKVILMGVIGYGSGIVIWILKRYWKPAMVLLLAPWLIMLLAMGFPTLRTGYLSWMNVAFEAWSQKHVNAGVYFLAEATEHQILLFCMFLAVITGELIWLLTVYRRVCLYCIYSMVWFWLLLMCENFRPLTCGLMLIGLFGMWICRRKYSFTRTGFLWGAILAAALIIAAAVIPVESMPGIDAARSTLDENIRVFRYGQDYLPEGDLYASNQLKSSTEDMIQVQTEQTKSLYLRGYTGTEYENGRWWSPVNSLYRENDSGMLKWLRQQGFDPETQIADYYSLCDGSEQPEDNSLQVNVLEASSYYIYTPSTVKMLSDRRITQKQDFGWKNRGFRGDRSYTMTEVSDVKPAELTIMADWVNDPQTEAQKNYCEAENVYRNFVYDNYTKIDSQMYDLMDETFWKDYQSDSDGIYSAVTQIRTVLKDLVQYQEQSEAAPENEDPLRWFLKESHTGNDMQYASVAVEALRAHGIPARYVEGYYISSADISASQEEALTLNGKNTHAWAEVYFDGIGWLPIDVTPGYYYDAVTLQQMVSSPDTVHKKAVLEDNRYGTDQIQDMQSGGNKKMQDTLKKVWDVTKIGLGILAVIIVIIVILFAIFELFRSIRIYLERKRYKNGTSGERVYWLQRYIYHFLWLAGIESGLGWNTETTDAVAAERIPGVEAGEYTNVCKLLEKSVYGETALENYEERTVLTFLYKVADYRKTCGWKKRMQFRYHTLFSPRNRVHKKKI